MLAKRGASMSRHSLHTNAHTGTLSSRSHVKIIVLNSLGRPLNGLLALSSPSSWAGGPGRACPASAASIALATVCPNMGNWTLLGRLTHPPLYKDNITSLSLVHSHPLHHAQPLRAP